MRILGIQIGKPRTLGTAGAADPMDREWTTAFYKEPVSGAIHAGVNGLDGDGQADLRVHGGPDKAINAYPADHFPYWKQDLGIDFPNGAFGENLTTLGATEDGVCIGDIYQAGGVVLQVTQPREPCWKLARRWRVKDLSARVERTGKTGWYFRVLNEGGISPETELVLESRPFPEWTLTVANQVMHHRKTDWQAAADLAACPALSRSWRETLSRRAALRAVESGAPRPGGNDP